MKSLKIGATLFLVTIATVSAMFYATLFSRKAVHGRLYFIVYINNFANFFVYFWIEDKFRNWILRRNDQE